MKKLLKVETPNKMIFIKGLLVRTPFESVIEFKEELDLLISLLIHQGVKYVVEDYIEEEEVQELTSKKVEEEKPVVKEKVAKTILENIAKE